MFVNLTLVPIDYIGFSPAIEFKNRVDFCVNRIASRVPSDSDVRVILRKIADSYQVSVKTLSRAQSFEVDFSNSDPRVALMRAMSQLEDQILSWKKERLFVFNETPLLVNPKSL